MLQRDDSEHPVPEPLRPKFRQIADAFVAGDFQLRHHPIVGVAGRPGNGKLDSRQRFGLRRNACVLGRGGLGPVNLSLDGWLLADTC